MSHFVQLNIIGMSFYLSFFFIKILKLLVIKSKLINIFSEPTVTIEANDGRVHAHQGSDVEFKCLIRGMLQKPAYVFW